MLSSQRTRNEQPTKMKTYRKWLSALLQSNFTGKKQNKQQQQKNCSPVPTHSWPSGQPRFSSSTRLQCGTPTPLPGTPVRVVSEKTMYLAGTFISHCIEGDNLGSLDFYSSLTIEINKADPPHCCGIKGGSRDS